MKLIALCKIPVSLALIAVLLMGMANADELTDITTAAQSGDPAAQSTLGQMYAQGKGVPRDDAQAIVWLRKAAEQGVLTSSFRVVWVAM